MNSLFIGLMTCDQVYRIDDFLERNHKHYASEHHLYAGGPVTNAAFTYGALGGNPTLVTAVGNNPFSDFLSRDIRDFVPKICDLWRGKDVVPPVATVLSSASNGDRTVITTVPSDVPITQPLNLTEMITSSKSLLVDGFYLDLALRAASCARSLGRTVIFDGGTWKSGMEDLLRSVDIAIVSERFVAPGWKDALDALSRFGVSHIAITRGQKAIIAQSVGETREIPVDTTSAADTLAAGDILHGAFVYYWNRGFPFVDALVRASRVATFSCRFFGPRRWVNEFDEHFAAEAGG